MEGDGKSCVWSLLSMNRLFVDVAKDWSCHLTICLIDTSNKSQIKRVITFTCLTNAAKDQNRGGESAG